MAAKRVDAIVIGAGPAGASAARTLVAGGMETLLVEKKKLPRPKMCSGLLGHWTTNFVHRKFGVIPQTAYVEPPFLKGVALNFPSSTEPVLIPGKSPIPYVWRDRFDHFLAKASGATIKDGLRMEGIETEGEGYRVLCTRARKDGGSTKVVLRSKYVVAADSSNSRAVRLMLPEAVRGLPWATGIQMHVQGGIRIDPDYFHAFFHRDVGVYAWANVKDGRILVGVAGIGKNKAVQYLGTFLALLKGVYGLKIEETLRKEGMAGLMMAPLGRFALGRDNFLAAGDAAGFMHNGGEGISCALTTGDLAAQAVLSAKRTGSKAIDIYRRIVRGEIDLCLDQTNLVRMFGKLPLPLDLRAFWRDRSLRDIPLILRDLKAFGAQDNGMKETGFGDIARRNMIHRLLRGRYPDFS